uniref:CAAX prenyl protease n=1 Tax=Eutreptiella gymnastica TaxID=73025 RepID=A0A7S4FTD5_9EUGL
MAKNDFGYVSDAYGTATNFLQVWLWPIVWQLVSDTALSNHDLYNPCVFALSLTTLETILGEPVAIYSTFVIEERFGFNNYTAGSYIKDKLKNFAVNVLIEAILWVGLILVVDWAGKNAWFYLWVFLSLFVLVFNMLYPVVIAPLTNTFKPLEEGELKKGIEQLIAQTGLNCKKVFEVDGSKQSKHSNAYVAGMLGTKRIVIYDTLVTDLDGDIDMIKSVVGHEIGHSIEHHQWVLLVTSLVNFFILFWTYGFFQNTPSVVTSFGFKEVNTYLSLRCFMTVYTGLIFPLWMVAMNAVTRWLEFRADRYSARLGYDIRPSLLKISKTNKGDLNPDWLHSLWHHNHPPLLERLHAVTEYMKKSK